MSSNVMMLRLREALRSRTSKLEPSSLASGLAALVRPARYGPQPWLPRHEVVLLVAAGCAYTSSWRARSATERDIRSAVNVFREHDPMACDLPTQTNIDVWLRKMARQQLELQETFPSRATARLLLMFGSSAGERGRSVFERIVGCTAEEAVISLKGVAAALQLAPSRRLAMVELESLLGKISAHRGHQAINKIVCTTQDDLVDWYRSLFEASSPAQAWALESPIASQPVVRFNDGSVVAPLVDRVVRAGAIRLIDHVTPSLKGGFGQITEDYIESLLRELSTGELERGSEYVAGDGARDADFVLHLPDESIVLEVKSARFSRRYLGPRTIDDDNVTKKIREADIQTTETARRVREEHGQDRVVSRLVVVLKPPPLPNVRLGPECESSGDPIEAPLEVIAIEEFERLCVLLEAGASFAAMAKLRRSDTTRYGDWTSFLEREESERDARSLSPLMLDALERAQPPRPAG